MTSAAIIVAAGSGSRARRSHDSSAKQYIKVDDKTILHRSLEIFLQCDDIDHVLTVIAEGDVLLYEEAIAPLLRTLSVEKQKKLLPPTSGGTSRQSSVHNGLQALTSFNPDFVLIHDAARPFVSETIIKACQSALTGHNACLVAAPVTDTIKQADQNLFIEKTIDRSTLWAAQTPQAFHFPFILKAHEAAHGNPNLSFTDDAAVAEWAGATVRIVEGSPSNIKITNPEDLDMAEKTFQEATKPVPGKPLTDIRLGTGYDVHAFEDGDAVMVGGIAIPHEKKLKGHSDADVGLHAITDAILGALADGDIGTHFPPTDPRWKGASSDLFLKDAVRRVAERQGRIGNIDLTIICEAPKIGPHRPEMRKAIATICNISLDRVSVKATTSERLGFTGRKEGIAALASACIHLPDPDL